MAQTKATKKFERDHLKDTIKRRKDFSKIKQRHNIKNKKQAKKAQEAETEPRSNGDGRKSKTDTQSYADMGLDDFFQGGFQVPEDLDKAGKPKQTTPKGQKRKRGQEAKTEDPEALSSEDSVNEAFTAGQDSASDSDAEDGADNYKQQLEGLAEKDPEFHKYLQENDSELLNFEDADLGEIDGLSASEDEEGPKKKRSKKEAGDKPRNEVTKAMLKKWDTAMKEQNSLRAMREVALAFRAAVHASDEEEKEYKYSISNPNIYHELLILALKSIPDVVAHHVPIKESQSGRVRVPTDSAKYRSLTPFLKSHVASLNHLLGHLSDAATLRLTLSSLNPLLPYILSFRKLLRDVSKTVVGVWSESSTSETGRIEAFLVLRRLVVIGDTGIRETILKLVYQGLVKGSRNTTIHTISGINLMKNSGAELWGIDASVGYTTGFSFIRQLAIHLRSSITNNSNESYKTIYNWQYVHSLDFWSRVLSTHCDALTEAKKGQQSPFRQLIYPVVQVTLGAMRLIPTSAYFPLRFQLVRSLLRISLSSGTYIPLAASLYEVLNSTELRKPPKGSSLRPLDFTTSIRAPKAYIKTRIYQDGLGEQVAELLSEFFVLWSKSIAFPELALPVIVLLKRWLKEVGPHSKAPNQNSKLSGQIGLLVQKIDANCRWIEERRAKVDFAPKDRAGVEGFLKDIEWSKTPIGAFVAGQRKTREEKAKVLEQGREAEGREKRREREEREDLEDDDIEDEDEIDE